MSFVLNSENCFVLQWLAEQCTVLQKYICTTDVFAVVTPCRIGVFHRFGSTCYLYIHQSFFHQLMDKRIAPKGILKFTLKQLQHISV